MASTRAVASEPDPRDVASEPDPGDVAAALGLVAAVSLSTGAG